MADAMMVDDLTDSPKLYFCHICNIEVTISNSDFICPLCANGFVEELPANPSETASTAAATSSGGQSDSSGSSSDSSSSGSGDTISVRAPITMRNVIVTLRRNAPILEHLPVAGANAEIGARQGEGNGGGGNSNVVFLGNVADPEWTRWRLAPLVTQMLSQIHALGSPPLSSHRINAIPNVQVTAEDVEHNTRCSICREDFKLEETVRKLPCTHLYHDVCIVPWLNLHSTCPICRTSLVVARISNNDSSLLGFNEQGSAVQSVNPASADPPTGNNQTPMDVTGAGPEDASNPDQPSNDDDDPMFFQ